MIGIGFFAVVALIGVGDACEDAVNRGQQHGNACSGAHARKIDAELNRVWKEAIPALREQDKEWSRVYGQSRLFEKVLEEQRAWVRYREAYCDHQRFTFYGGSAAPWIYNECMTSMAIDRIKYLKNITHPDR